MGKLTGKVAIVTGASRGIGRAIALELAKEGAAIVINYSKDDEGAEITYQMLKEIGVSAMKIKKDISIYENTEDIVNETINHFGKIDILVNNAARSVIGLFMDAGKDEIDSLIKSNLLGAMYLTKNVIAHMLTRGGTILNISSMWGDVGASCEVLYSASKGGINLFTKALAKEMAPSNIRVNAIAPGVINTKMNSFLNEEDKKELEDEIPMGRFGEAEEIGKIAAFLCSDDSSYITGQIIRADGGMI
ncbi:MAG: SDR family oxidoreductase [Clostridium sp.]|jgi:3-oxoacyl-[acyl-carrier protein] reductase|nr:SDR family oxidoreductase [Clostridium sp.]